MVHKVASTAKSHLDEARALSKDVAPPACRLLLPAVACGNYLEALEKADFNPYDPKLLRAITGTPLWHVLQVKWHLWMGTY